jgi:glycosyltransferase involved in cell wall biosynthesis
MTQLPAPDRPEELEGPPPPQPDLPVVSVIMAVRNEEGFIGPCLQALAQQDYPRENFEVIVLDGESTDATISEAQTAAAELGVPDVFLTNRKRTTAAGLNLGLSMARGEIIVKVDGHTLVDPRFLSAGVRALRESGADAVGGPIRTVGRGPVGQAIALAVSSPFGVGDAAFRHATEAQWTDSVAFGAYRREVFERIGGFDEDALYGEDDEFNYRLRDAGGRILLTPEIGSVYYSRSSYGSLSRQYWRYGIAKAGVLRTHPGRLRWRHLVPSALVASLVGLRLLSPIARPFARLHAVVVGTYAGFCLFASVWVAFKGGHWRIAPLIPLAFPCIHLPAGAGLLYGFLRHATQSRETRASQMGEAVVDEATPHATDG